MSGRRHSGWDTESGAVAALLAIVSLTLVFQSIHRLGRQWAIRARTIEGHALITTGPYAVIRHPIYVGMGGFLVAVGLAFAPSWALAAAIMFYAAGSSIRARAADVLTLLVSPRATRLQGERLIDRMAREGDVMTPIPRRLFLQALGAAAASTPVFAQTPAQPGRNPQQPRDTPPLVPPFEPTGWKTVWLDHLNYQCIDYKKAAAFYATLMGWKVRSDDGKQALLDIGENSGGILIRGGLTAPPPAAITDAGLGVNRPQIQAVFDGFAWGIEPWDTDAVKAALEKRGLKPVADHHGSDYKSFRVKDPDGFDLAVTNGTKANRRKSPASGKLPAPAPFEPTGWKTLYLDHISFEVPDFRRSAAFYRALLGWEMRPGNGTQVSVQIGDIAGAIIRGNAAARATARGEAPSPPPASGVTAAIGHISFGIEHWNTERVRDELKTRGVVYVNAEGQREPRPDMTGTLESFHVPDAMGWDLQIGNKIAPGR